MNKTWIIIQREFINRVSKKSFILLTILMPFIFAALIFVPLWLSTVKGGDQKQNDIGFLNGEINLHADLVCEILLFQLDSSGIDQIEGLGKPFCLTINAVPGYAGRIIDDAFALAENAIEYGRFADIRAADNRYCAFYHMYFFLPEKTGFISRKTICSSTSVNPQQENDFNSALLLRAALSCFVKIRRFLWKEPCESAVRPLQRSDQTSDCWNPGTLRLWKFSAD